MKNFLRKLTIYILLICVLLSVYILIVYFRPDFVDNFYYRFTTPKANSLILGTSRAAQGIKPEIINRQLCLNDSNKIINHAFAAGPSDFGPNYYREITQKLNKDSKNGLFIISVIPWDFCTTIDNADDDSLQFFEVRKKLFVGNLKSSSTNPNFEYLWQYWNNKFSVFEMLFKHMICYKGILELHSDGWLEVDIPMDSLSVIKRIMTSSESATESARYKKWSNTRFYFFEKIVRYLRNRGEIYLVRLPVSKPMAELENRKFPDFDNKMRVFADKYNIKYIDFINESGNYLTIDTHHLWKEESEKITYRICDSILANRNKKLAKVK